MAKGFCSEDYAFFPSDVRFSTAEEWLQQVYQRCEAYAAENKALFQDKVVLREGAVYDGLWLETQPMGGEMYAKRDLSAALNNQLIFMEYQRRDGRFPGTIHYTESGLIEVHFGWLSGYSFPAPAFRMYYLIGKDKGYLQRLYHAMADFDRYLWAYRDSDKDGCLETWCVWDTGEDHCTRFERFGAKEGGWGGETPPYGQGRLPYESMQMMAYSCQGREMLAEASRLLDNGEEGFWRAGAQKVRDKIREYLWDEKKYACYDRDCENKRMDILLQGNLQCMHYGAFSQEMADRFVRYHLMNPREFWTKLPLPSIAVNDPFFYNNPQNDWSGQVQGLSYQRAIQALENYGYEAELRLLGKKWLENLSRTGCYVQQYDPFTGEPGTKEMNGYGPTVLAALEYISRMYGVSVSMDKVKWSVVDRAPGSVYIQEILGREYRLEQDGKQIRALIDNEEIFCACTGIMVETTVDGELLRVCNISESARQIQLWTQDLKLEKELGRNGCFQINKAV